MIKWEQNKYLAFLEEKFGDILKGSKRQVFDPQRHSCQARVQVQGLSQISNKRPGPGA